MAKLNPNIQTDATSGKPEVEAPHEMWLDTIVCPSDHGAFFAYSKPYTNNIRYIRADLIPAWQPIETAPKTTKSRLVWCPANFNIYLVYWGDIYETVTGRVIRQGWRHFGGSGGPLNDTPTMWMSLESLPTPPEGGEFEGNKLEAVLKSLEPVK